MKTFRFQDPITISEKDVKDRLSENEKVYIQFSKPGYTIELLLQLDDLALSHSSRLAIRFYDNGGVNGFDCALLENLPNVKSLFLGCFPKIKNIHLLGQLHHLQQLGIDALQLDDAELLAYDNLKKLKYLSLCETKSKINLEYLKDYKDLQFLAIADQTKNINALADLTQLKTLRLMSIKNTSLNFINGLSSLKELVIVLGGRKDLNEIETNNIEDLEISWVRGLNEVSVLKNFKTLRNLTIENEAKLTKINFPKLDLLDTVKILGCKNLKNISGLENLVSLTNFRISEPAFNFDYFSNLKFPSNLKTLAFYTWKSKQDKVIRKRLDEMGFNEFGF